jgi:hypothetical protein
MCEMNCDHPASIVDSLSVYEIEQAPPQGAGGASNDHNPTDSTTTSEMCTESVILLLLMPENKSDRKCWSTRYSQAMHFCLWSSFTNANVPLHVGIGTVRR